MTRSAHERRRRCTAAQCWSTFKALATVSAVAFGIVCIVLMPDYRIYAAFVVSQALIVYFQLWRFTPCDRSRVNAIVEERIEEFLLSGKDPRQLRRGAGTHRRDTATSSSARRHSARCAEQSEDSHSDDDAPSEKPRISKNTPKGRPRSSKTKTTTPRDAKKHKKTLRRDIGSSDDGNTQLQRRDAVDERTPTRPTRTPSFHIDPSGLLHAPYGGSPAGFLPSLLHHHNQQVTPYHHTPTHHQHHHGPPHFWTETSLPSYAMAMPTAPPQSSRGASLHGSPSSAIGGYLGGSPYGGGASGSKTPSKRRVVREIVSGDDDDGADDALARPYVLDMGYG
jgi:hypothetical protein